MENVHQKTIMLSGYLGSESASSDIELSLTIAAGENIVLVDDLTRDGYPNQTHKITLTVHEHGTVFYRMQLSSSEPEVSLEPVVKSDQEQSMTVTKELTFNLIGAHASAHGLMTWLGKESRKLIITTSQHHQVPHTTSSCTIKSVLDDKSQLSCTSIIKVDKMAQHTQALQVNKNIMLSKMARVLSVPQLEIEANDVSCKHGAAVSQFNDDQKFYLQSRGLDAHAARAMLIDAFLGV